MKKPTVLLTVSASLAIVASAWPETTAAPRTVPYVVV